MSGRIVGILSVGLRHCRPDELLAAVDVVGRARERAVLVISGSAGALLAGRAAAQHDDVVLVARGGLCCRSLEGQRRAWGTPVAPVKPLANARVFAHAWARLGGRGFPVRAKRRKPRERGAFESAPKRTRTSTRLSRTRPSTLSPGCQMCPCRARTSDASGNSDATDASDDLDVATDVATTGCGDGCRLGARRCSNGK